MAITKFEVGKWYVYHGVRKGNWNYEGEMDGVLDRKPHKCVKIDDEYDGMWRAGFEDIANGRLWSWFDSMDGFEEVPAPFVPKKGDYIMVREHERYEWVKRLFVGMTSDGKYECVMHGQESSRRPDGTYVLTLNWPKAKPVDDFSVGETILVRDSDSAEWIERELLRIDDSHPYGRYLCRSARLGITLPWRQAKKIDKPKPTFKRGDEVLVWDGEAVDESQKKRRIYISTIEGANCPYNVVSYSFERAYKNGESFGTTGYEHIEPAPPKKPARETVSLKLIKDEIGRYTVITSKGDEVTGSRLRSMDSKLGEPLTVTIEFKLTEEEI